MYYAFLGHTPPLSILELVCFDLDPQPVTANLAALTRDPLPVADSLGGTVKIAAQVALCPHDPVSLLATLSGLISSGSAKNVAITNLTPLTLSKSDLYHLKSSVSRPLRLVSLETGGHELVLLRKQHVAEYNLLPQGDQVAIAQTVWIQDGIGWARRDRGRPYQDIKRGLLPPKLARLMVNLAARGGEGSLLDPFCGTGTVLLEGALAGLHVIGSDNDPLAIEGTRRNLAWLSLPGELNVCDATHISSLVSQADYIVTEPYLGPLLDLRRLPPPAKLANLARGLDKLYRGCLKDWKSLQPQRIVMILPEFHLPGGSVIPVTSIDTLSRLGYNVVAQVNYSKPGAVVIRQITILEPK